MKVTCLDQSESDGDLYLLKIANVKTKVLRCFLEKHLIWIDLKNVYYAKIFACTL